jgi:hypothetical protein
LRGLDLLRASQNIIAAWTGEHYRTPIMEHRVLGHRLFVLNDPATIQHVLLDNASNYLPFGGGARTCLGASLAMTELLVAVAGILRGFKISIVPGQRIEPTAHVMLRPRDGIKAVLRPR